MRIWVDLTNSPHVLVLRPVIRALEAQGHRSTSPRATSRRRSGSPTGSGSPTRRSATTAAAGSPRRASASPRARSRSRAGPRASRFDAALGHGSNDVTVAAKLLGIPSATTFDYEWATAQHTVNCRLARRVVVPDAIPPERLARYGATPQKLRRYPGLKEEYYLADFTPDAAVLGRARARRGAAARRRPHAAGGLALPPLRAPALRPAARAAARAGADRRAPAHARAARGARGRRRLRHPRARGRRAVARRTTPTSSSPRAAR